MGGHCGRFRFLWNVLVEGRPWQDQETSLGGIEEVPGQLGPEVLEAHSTGCGALSEREGV